MTPTPDLILYATLPASGNAYQIVRSITFGDLAVDLLLAAVLIYLVASILAGLLPRGARKVSVQRDNRPE
jgi:multisubunit Na+/H+ antiporter MnhG subunit